MEKVNINISKSELNRNQLNNIKTAEKAAMEGFLIHKKGK